MAKAAEVAREEAAVVALAPQIEALQNGLFSAEKSFRMGKVDLATTCELKRTVEHSLDRADSDWSPVVQEKSRLWSDYESPVRRDINEELESQTLRTNILLREAKNLQRQTTDAAITGESSAADSGRLENALEETLEDCANVYSIMARLRRDVMEIETQLKFIRV